jgi:hypothetical protein
MTPAAEPDQQESEHDERDERHVNHEERIGQDDVEVLERCHGWKPCRAEKMRWVVVGRVPSRGAGDRTFSDDAPWSFVATFFGCGIRSQSQIQRRLTSAATRMTLGGRSGFDGAGGGGPDLSAGRFNPRVEHANGCPVIALFLDELGVFRSRLVLVVGGFVGEDDMEGDVEVAVVDFPIELIREHAGGEPDGPGMIGQVVLASGDQGLLGYGGRILKFEEDVVREHGLGFLRGGSGGDHRDHERTHDRKANNDFHGIAFDCIWLYSDRIRIPE